MHFQLEIQKCTSSGKTERSELPVGKTEVQFQLGRQKCTSNWENRSVLAVTMTEAHLQLERQKCTSSRGDRSVLLVRMTEVHIRTRPEFRFWSWLNLGRYRFRTSRFGRYQTGTTIFLELVLKGGGGGGGGGGQWVFFCET